MPGLEIQYILNKIFLHKATDFNRLYLHLRSTGTFCCPLILHAVDSLTRSCLHCYSSSATPSAPWRMIWALPPCYPCASRSQIRTSCRNGAAGGSHPNSSWRPWPWLQHPPDSISTAGPHRYLCSESLLHCIASSKCWLSQWSRWLFFLLCAFSAGQHRL